MIDMHTHWRPAELLEAMRNRDKEPRILKNDQGVEVLRMRGAPDTTLDQAFDTVGFHLGKMQRQGVTTSVLSLLGSFCWIESQPVEQSVPLCRLYNDAVSKLCADNEGRFLAYAATPLRDMKLAAEEFDRAMGLPGIVGINNHMGSLFTSDPQALAPVMEELVRRGLLFVDSRTSARSLALRSRPAMMLASMAAASMGSRARSGRLAKPAPKFSKTSIAPSSRISRNMMMAVPMSAPIATSGRSPTTASCPGSIVRPSSPAG